jgi:GNAT superfamily N-acetyltransferase
MDRRDGPVTIEPVGSRITATAGVLASSLVDAPGATLRRTPSAGRWRLLRTVLAAVTRDAVRHGNALAAVDGDGQVVGGLLLMPPGTYPVTGRRRVRMTATMLRAAIRAPRRFAAFRRAAAARGATLPAGGDWWMLHTIGVHPRAHRRGVAAGLMREAMSIIDSTGLPCHLHTASPAAAALFRSFGFAAGSGSADIPRTDGSRVVLMTRPGPATGCRSPQCGAAGPAPRDGDSR